MEMDAVARKLAERKMAIVEIFEESISVFATPRSGK